MKSKLLFCFVVVLLTVTAAATAQGMFDPLLGKVETGTSVTVIDNTGQKVNGELLSLGSSELKLSVDGEERVFTADQVAELRKPVRDSLWNGAVIGAAVGATPMIVLASAGWCSDEGDGCGAKMFAAGALYAGIGAGIGIAIDALIKKNVTFFKSEKVKVAVQPSIQGRKNGMQISLRF